MKWWEWKKSRQRVSARDRAVTVGGRLYDTVKEHNGVDGRQADGKQAELEEGQKMLPYSRSLLNPVIIAIWYFVFVFFF